MFVSARTYDAMVAEASTWKKRALEAEAANLDLFAENGSLSGRAESLQQQINAAVDATAGLRTALNAGAEKATPHPAEADLKRELERAIAQLASQAKALDAYEAAHLELNDALRTLAEERNAAVATVERMSREGAWTPEGVA